LNFVAIAVNSPVFMPMPMGKYHRRQDIVYWSNYANIEAITPKLNKELKSFEIFLFVAI
jgi:hypothetical protein